MGNAKVYDQGYRAFKRGVRLDDCPYHCATSRQSDNNRQWRSGWNDAASEAGARKNEYQLGYMQGRGAA